MPFLGFDCFPPGHCQPDFVSPRHKDMFMTWKSVLPNPYAIGFMRWTTWELAKYLD
jgi:hypothetical protein